VTNIFSSPLKFSSLQVGIVGLPNVGKSTLFNTLTKMGIPADNFPFCTIDPNNVCCRRVNLFAFPFVTLLRIFLYFIG